MMKKMRKMRRPRRDKIRMRVSLESGFPAPPNLSKTKRTDCASSEFKYKMSLSFCLCECMTYAALREAIAFPNQSTKSKPVEVDLLAVPGLLRKQIKEQLV
jgi:hypothetical protein